MVFLAVEFFLGAVIGGGTLVWAYILAFIAWIWAYKSSFETDWLQGVAIAFLAVVAFGRLSLLAGSLLGAMIPSGYFPTI